MCNKKIKILKPIISANGERMQIVQVIEELSELQKALCKYLKNVTENPVDNITEEMADVQIMLDQLRIIFDNEKEVEKIMTNKIDRTYKRLGIESETKSMIIAVDFDGTLCDNKYPEITNPNTKLIDYLIKCRNAGDKIILWTCREGELLNKAVEWCKEQGLEFDAINDNLQEHKEKYQNNCRKVFADRYIDDKNWWFK